MPGKISDFFAGVKMTAVSGIFLAASLALLLTGTKVPVDPAWVTVVISGYPLLYLAITRLIRQKWISSCLLISMAMFASLAIGELFAAGEVAFIMAVGAILEDMTVERAKKGISGLMKLVPDTARTLAETPDGLQEKSIPAASLQIGTLVRVLPGERIPADGVIVSGESSVDQSVMTGESLPVDKKAGDSVFCGTMNCFGSMDFSVTGVNEDSSLHRMIRLVQEAENKKAPMQRIADKWSVLLVPVALAIAVGAFVINSALGVAAGDALNRAVTVLVVFCPCALALATPTSIVAAIGQAAKHGVIIKSGAALEAMGRADTVAFDKTGTLTCGTLEVSDMLSLDKNLAADEVLRLAGAAEARSEHPLGRALAAAAREKAGDALPTADNFRMQAGRGVSGTVCGKKLLCGSESFLSENSVDCSKAAEAVRNFRNEGKAVILIAADGVCIGAAALSDTPRPEAAEIVRTLNDFGMRTVLLTGDNRRAAAHFAENAGLSDIRAELLPEDKVRAVGDLRDGGHTVCMLGDGVNDAPALKAADVGIAMGGAGSDLTVEAADAALMQDNLSRLVYLKRLARSTISTIHFNITVSMLINAVAVTLSTVGILDPVTGALVHNVGSSLIVLNAALLYDRKFDR